MRRSNLARKPRGDVLTKFFSLRGGMNLVDAPITMDPGMALAAVNYELLSRDGYRRVDGYERSDGQAKPSAATYWILDFDAGDVVTPVVDGHVVGLTSGATGKIGLVVLESGTWAGSDAAGYLVVFVLTGSFLNNETLSFTGAGDEYSYEYSNEYA